MTRRPRGETVEWALQTLYPHTTQDLTAEGYGEALQRLRSVDPALARRVQRALDPWLATRVFPRRQQPWHDTSAGTKARLVLLPVNPHFEADVVIIRTALGIPDGHIRLPNDHPAVQALRARLSPDGTQPDRPQRIIQRDQAAWWLHAHRDAVQRGTVSEPVIAALEPAFLGSAVRAAAATLEDEAPEPWLRRPQDAGGARESVAPMDWAIDRLLARHGLPSRIGVAVALFVLTQDPTCLTNLPPLAVRVAHPEQAADPGAFAVCVEGIDEYTTREDWIKVWDTYGHARQESLWGQRGMKPHGRRSVDVARLAKAMPLYREMVLQQLTVSETLKRPSTSEIELDQETLRRAMDDLNALLRPLP